MNPELDEQRLQRCMDLFAVHQRRLFLYISAMVPSPADADEILAETNVVIWKKFDQFDPETPGSDFLSWAFAIAQFQVLDYRRRRARAMTSLSAEVLDQVTVTMAAAEPLLEARREALTGCLRKLPDADRTLIEQCYAPEAKVSAVAEYLSRETTSVYRSLRRIREVLAQCVERRLAEEASP